ncbi:MAG: diguanylate cyclase [Spirochaetes bacterium]|jgi:diguanylate cyclase (GGDEF)-like protein|nr:diguanylate cyclase [Spirochaetota bacterium]
MQNITSVLVIDHEAQSRDLLIQQLRGEGYEVIGATSYEEGDARFEEGSVDIVILDLEQDSDAGVALTKDVRRRAGNRPLQIVLTSENADDSTLRHGLEVGADDFVGKPLRPLEVTLRIRAAYVRLREELDLYHEREFYRQAAKEEEELSARVLDQNVHLRRAYDRAEERNRDLARMNRQLQRVARYDALSGLMNRTSLFHVLDVEMERSVRVDAPLCVLMIDIDHFKPINDEYGHGCGDEVIRRIGEVLKTERRKYDYCGRYGGEEFLMVLPNTALPDTAVVADRIRERLGEVVIACDNGRGDEFSITASVGVARYRGGETRDMWIARADRAMYVAKQRGRNRVELEVGVDDEDEEDGRDTTRTEE